MKLDNALRNAIAQWPYVMHALDDGRLPLDNNLAERAIRPFVVGRKNWLFCDTPRGARMSCAAYSVVTTARANGLDDRAYVEWLLSEMPADPALSSPDPDVSRYLPWSGSVPVSCKARGGNFLDGQALEGEPVVDVEGVTRP